MTQIRGHIAPSRRPGELGVHSLDHFALSVPDMERACRFYDAFGLDLRADGNIVGIHTFDHQQRWGLLVEGSSKKLHHLSFGVFEHDLEPFKRRIEELGVRLLDPPPGIPTNGLWFRDHDGTLIELRVAQKSSPDQKPAAEFISSPAGQAGGAKA